MCRLSSTLGRSISTVRSDRLKGSVLWLSRCRSIVLRSTVMPLSGKMTGSSITEAIIGSRNSSGTSTGSSSSCSMRAFSTASSKRQLKSWRMATVPGRAHSSGYVSFQSMPSRNLRPLTEQPPSPIEMCDSMETRADLLPPAHMLSSPALSTHACTFLQPCSVLSATHKLAMMPSTGARSAGRLILSMLAGAPSSILASAPTVVWLSTKPSSSTSRTMFMGDPLKNTAGISRATNSRMRSRLMLSSYMMVHLRWCCWRSGARRRAPAPDSSLSSVQATVNSVSVQLRVLMRRLRKAPKILGSVTQISDKAAWKTGLASSADLEEL
mmetsp:Transcript_7815/g.22258  ORF Transcript_7815/g.22258 Transcript_7815/m.22258 type:complete len:325 (-) Transcript_7815:2433-3407(-)